ncbi:S-adenosyl-L-methionine-dependent methyltransferase [Coprinopsis sp. MPI-PUGE-AT-0042]|nr:S-adenosyl-L-methionine-dependent methyltransferase [Coprinopsis sp. MPI-PUGE-AT-0042]
MAPRKRPNAFEVSFPGEVFRPEPAPARPGSSTSLKRRSEEPDLGPQAKRPKLPPVAYYKPRADEAIENEEFALPGEDDEDGPDSIPVRILTDFTIFDPKHMNEMVSLEAMDSDDGLDRAFSAAGYVRVRRAEEDAEDEEDEEEDEQPLQYIRLGAILTWSMNLTKLADPVYIQTPYAFYVLDVPSKGYTETFKHFVTPRTLAQTLFAGILRRPQLTLAHFLNRLTNTVDMFGRTWLESDFRLWVGDIDGCLDDPEISDHDRTILKTSTLVKQQVLGRSSKLGLKKNKKPRSQSQALAMHNRQLPADMLVGNPDRAVTLPENLNPTHVTPRIAQLSYGLVNEELQVVGARLPSTWQENWDKNAEKRKALVKDLILRAKLHRPRTHWKVEDKVKLGSKYLKKVVVEKIEYAPGDVVLMRSPNHPIWDGKYENIEFELGDIFWFGRILWLDHSDTKKGVHVQWFEHASATLLQELADPQELFLTDMHDDKSWAEILAKVTVHWDPAPDAQIPPADFFCRQMYHQETSAWYAIPQEYAAIIAQAPGQNCPTCVRETEKAWDNECVPLTDQGGDVTGYKYMGQRYHLQDFVLYYGEGATANIGYVIDIQLTPEPGQKYGFVTVQKLGRMVDLSHLFPTSPSSPLKDERELYLTKEKASVNIDTVFTVAYVACMQALGGKLTKEEWVQHSPWHYCVQYIFPTLNPRNLDKREIVQRKDYPVCDVCWLDKLADMKRTRKFIRSVKRDKDWIPTLDLFAGVGAFSQGLVEGSGCLKVTHAIEISPSAALTLQRNHPNVVVYNQCANTMLRHFIKNWEGHLTEPVKQLHNSQRIPQVPSKGYIKAIVAGFPCQGHSGLNMYQNANDIRNNLLLTTASYVDAIRPDYAFFENVPNFLNYQLNARQAGIHRVEGGIEKGGIKIVVRALLDMGYQVRFAKLQAAHYGTPQDRVRLILMAARQGKTLPEFPHPSHGFSSDSFTKSLNMNLPYGREGKSEIAAPLIRLKPGTAPNPPVTIEDAISDLPLFDWRMPGSTSSKARNDLFGRQIPVVSCNPESDWWGYESRSYHTKPQTRFQLESRKDCTLSRQQFTRCLDPGPTNRVIKVPLTQHANYLSLEPRHQEWQTQNPLSSSAKLNHRAPRYGRLYGKDYFPTTVTNMGPTAKQSRVLNPWCRRMLTVRELARSQGFPDDFFFVALKNRVVTMHSQIGNAVPLPLGRAIGRELREAVLKGWERKPRAPRTAPVQAAVPAPLTTQEDDDDDMYE